MRRQGGRGRGRESGSERERNRGREREGERGGEWEGNGKRGREERIFTMRKETVV